MTRLEKATFVASLGLGQTMGLCLGLPPCLNLNGAGDFADCVGVGAFGCHCRVLKLSAVPWWAWISAAAQVILGARVAGVRGAFGGLQTAEWYLMTEYGVPGPH